MTEINYLKKKLKNDILMVVFVLPIISVISFNLALLQDIYILVLVPIICFIFGVKKSMDIIDNFIDIKTSQSVLTANLINEYTASLIQSVDSKK